MNKSAIEKFAVRARKRLREQVEQKAFEIGISAKEIKPVQVNADDAIVVNGRVFNKFTKYQRERLVREIECHGFDHVMDEAAYTWFNRFIALRFMEVNGYLETGVRVFSSSNPNKKEPDLLTYAASVNLPVDRSKVYELQEKNAAEALYKMLIIAQCNELHQSMPFLFEKIADYTELLFPGNLLTSDSVIREMVREIPDEDWWEVEIIGWLYQYYISEKKDEVFAGLKKNLKITKENIPAATQLFTPHWIVRYMVENTVGRMWLEAHPNEELKTKWKYYLEPAEQKPEVQAELDKLVNRNLNPEEITILDPACGSGHILVYAFELLYDIYLAAGYVESEIPKLILEKNLYGLDIDNRAAQLACLAVAMKAREKNRNVLKENIRLNICAIQQTNELPEKAKEILMVNVQNKDIAKKQIENIWDTFFNAKEFGSIIRVEDFDKVFWQERLVHIEQIKKNLFDIQLLEETMEILPGIVKQAEIMSNRFDVVVTNPPYMSRSGMNPILKNYIDTNYYNRKADLFSVFIDRCINFLRHKCYLAMVTIHSWWFIQSFEKLRKDIITKHTFINGLQIGFNSFPGMNSQVAHAVTFIILNNKINDYICKFFNLNFDPASKFAKIPRMSIYSKLSI